jgi:nitric oxide reductase large subunit
LPGLPGQQLQLFPSGVLQLLDVIKNGYWHARNLEFSGQQHIVNLAWLRLPADLLFIFARVLPLLIAVIMTYFNMRNSLKKEVRQLLCNRVIEILFFTAMPFPILW